jgi:hypothetical protein
MNSRSTSVCGALLALIAVLLAIPAVFAADDDDVKAAFTAFQGALKAADQEKLWSALDTTAQADADNYAAKVHASYTKANDEEKAKLEKAFGLSADEMSKITGKLYLKSKPFLGKYREVPGSKIDKVIVEGDKATVHYIEEDGDKEKLQLVKQDGKWRLSVAVK